MKKLKAIGVASAMTLALAGLPINNASAAENENSDSELWNKAETLPSSLEFNDDSNVYGLSFGTDGSGSTKITAYDNTYFMNVEQDTYEVTPAGIPISKVKAVGKTTSKVTLATYGVTLTFMRNGSSLGTDKDTGVGKGTATATVTTSPESVSSGTEFRATSHHTLSKAGKIYSDDTGDSLKF